MCNIIRNGICNVFITGSQPIECRQKNAGTRGREEEKVLCVWCIIKLDGK